MHAGSDDFTLFLWEPTSHKLPRARMAGHMQLVNQVTAMRTAVLVHRIRTAWNLLRRSRGCKLLSCFALLQVTFSPDGRWIASASFDKSGVLLLFSCKDSNNSQNKQYFQVPKLFSARKQLSHFYCSETLGWLQRHILGYLSGPCGARLSGKTSFNLANFSAPISRCF